MRDATRLRIAKLAALAGLGLGAVCILAELLNGKPGEPSVLFGLTLPAADWAESAVVVTFGLVHLAVAAIITMHRRTAV